MEHWDVILRELKYPRGSRSVNLTKKILKTALCIG